MSSEDFELVTLATGTQTLIYAFPRVRREDDPVYLGYAMVAPSSWSRSPYRDAAELVELVVRKGHRRRGVGTALFRRAHSWTLDRGYPMLMVTAYSVNAGACRFYESLGLRPHYVTYDTFWQPPEGVE
jgi:GNAT superfamily N-acetyltransferase